MTDASSSSKKATTPCRHWASKHPGAGSHYPDPCKTCGWSMEDHGNYWQVRDAKHDVLVNVNQALQERGLSVAKGTIDGVEVYQVVTLPIVAQDTTDASSSSPEPIRQLIAAALRLAKEATNGWACYAKRKIEHDEIARLHHEIDALALLRSGGVLPQQNTEDERTNVDYNARPRSSGE